MFFSSESTRVSTEMMAKIPTVTPNKDRIVRSTLDFSALPGEPETFVNLS